MSERVCVCVHVCGALEDACVYMCTCACIILYMHTLYVYAHLHTSYVYAYMHYYVHLYMHVCKCVCIICVHVCTYNNYTSELVWAKSKNYYTDTCMANLLFMPG